MYQQINLYQPVFRRQRKIFSAVTMLQAMGIATVLLTAFCAHASWALQGMQTTAATLDTSYGSLEARMGILETTGDAAAMSDVDDALARLQATIESRQALLATLGQRPDEAAGRFSAFFELLAQHRLPGLWLTAIRIDDTGETELRGTTYDPALVPRYLQVLPAGPRITPLQRGSVQMTRQAADDTAVAFTISSDAGERL